MRLRHPIAALVAIACLDAQITAAQAFEVGVKGGVRTSDDLSGTLTPESKRYIVGPMLEVRLPLRLSFEFDALYQRYGFTGYPAYPAQGPLPAIWRERDNAWQFPMILKYHVPAGPLHAFGGIGFAPQVVHGSAVTSGSFQTGITSTCPPCAIYSYYINERSSTAYSATGLVVSGGLEVRAGRVRISPEFRLIHWGTPFLNEVNQPSYYYFSSQNDIQVLLGISFP